MKWNKSSINHHSRFNLEYSCHRPDHKSRKFTSRICVFLNLVKSETIKWRVLKLRLFQDSICFVFQNRDCKVLKVASLRLQFWIFRDWDLTKIIETEDFLRLSLISYQDYSTHNTVPKLNITSHTCTLIRDLRDQF